MATRTKNFESSENVPARYVDIIDVKACTATLRTPLLYKRTKKRDDQPSLVTIQVQRHGERSPGTIVEKIV